MWRQVVMDVNADCVSQAAGRAGDFKMQVTKADIMHYTTA